VVCNVRGVFFFDQSQGAKEDTKNCPNCSISIHKIDGCDLMWCVSCHCTFSWNSGKTVKVNHNHNPHYYQWLRDKKEGGEIPRVPGDNPCDEVPTPFHIINKMRIDAINPTNILVGSDLLSINRFVNEINEHILPRYNDQINHISDNLDLRLKYLLKEIDEDKWFKLLKIKQKKYDKQKETYQILDMFKNVSYDLLRSYINNISNYIITSISFSEITDYTNNELLKIAKKYNNKPISIYNKSLNKYMYE
jgi:hypothetical protein